MFRDVITRSTRVAEWPSLRAGIQARILASMGTPAADVDLTAPCRVLDSCIEYRLHRDTISIEVMPGLHCAGFIYHPLDVASGVRLAGVVCIHGTSHDLARKAVACPERHPDAAYAVELAAAGHVAITVD